MKKIQKKLELTFTPSEISGKNKLDPYFYHYFVYGSIVAILIYLIPIENHFLHLLSLIFLAITLIPTILFSISAYADKKTNIFSYLSKIIKYYKKFKKEFDLDDLFYTYRILKDNDMNMSDENFYLFYDNIDFFKKNESKILEIKRKEHLDASEKYKEEKLDLIYGVLTRK